jgi:hypothetical protein
MIDRRSFAGRVLTAGAGLLALKAGKAKASERRWKRGDVVAWDWQHRVEWVFTYVSKENLSSCLKGKAMRGPNHGRAFDVKTGEEVFLVRYYSRQTATIERYKQDEMGQIAWHRGQPIVIVEHRRLRLEFADGRVVE